MSPARSGLATPPADIIDVSLATAKLLDKGGYSYLVHPLMDGIPRVEPALLQAWVDWAAGNTDLISKATLLVAPEAMGLPLVAPLSLTTGLPYVVLRKRKYDLPGEEIAYCETGYGAGCLYVNGIAKTDRVLLIDDVLSTGGTLTSLIGTMTSMTVAVVGALVFLDKGTARTNLQTQSKVPIRAMRSIVIENGKIRILT